VKKMGMYKIIPANRIVRELSGRDQYQLSKVLRKYQPDPDDEREPRWAWPRLLLTGEIRNVKVQPIAGPRCGCGMRLDGNGNCVVGEPIFGKKTDITGRLMIVGYQPHQNRGKKARKAKARRPKIQRTTIVA
jgi:hypothetical protein